MESDTPEGRTLQQDLALFTSKGIQPRMEVRHGLVVDEILNEAQAGDHDLIVIGAHHEEGWQRLLLDDIALQITNRADRPILIMR